MNLAALFANHFVLKLILAPIIIASATLVARRWGESIGGLMVGLPLTSGPVSIFFAIEQGRAFAQHAALGAMLGLVPVAIFCLGYVWAAKRLVWYLSALVGISMYLAAVWMLSFVQPALLLIAVSVPLTLAAALWLVGTPRLEAVKIVPPWWDLPLRILIATCLLVGITTAAGALGPQWSGLLSPFPIFTFVMATFAHSQAGGKAAWQFIRGVLTGLFSYTAFFIVIALLVKETNLPLVYVLAACAALAINAISLVLLLVRRRNSEITPIFP